MRRGNATIEFTFVGIPMLFVMISTFEIARAMWIYHTLAYAVKEGTRFAMVKGQNCSVGANACAVTVGRVATEIKNAGPGLLPDQLNVTLWSGYSPEDPGSATTIPCNPLNTCFGNTAQWPPAGQNELRHNIRISASYPFRSALSMFWPGSAGQLFSSLNFPADSVEQIKF